LNLDQKQVERAKPYPPLATLQVVNVLRRAGHQVSFFDAMLAQGTADYTRELGIANPQLVVFYEDNFNFLSKMCLSAMRGAACEMMGSARRMGARVIAAGADVTDAPKDYLVSGAEAALSGEAISSLLELVSRLDMQPRLDVADWVQGLPGVSSLIDGDVVAENGHRPLPMAKDAAMAAWDLVDIERYRAIWIEAHGYFSLNMAASRGCPFRCAWCAKPIWGNQYLQRDAREVVAEMAVLKRNYRPDHIWFADDIFGFRVDWVTDFAAAAKAADAMIPFTIQTRADLVSDAMARALHQAGCKEAWIGAETGSQRVLDAMNKGTTVAQILTARERLRAVGIRVGFFIQLGYLDERLEDITATRELLRAARPDEIGVSVSYPLPGTKFHDLVKAQLRGKTHWHESSDLEMMFQGTYTSEFYRAVRDCLHGQIAAQTDVLAEQALEMKWRGLLARESQYRSSPRDRFAVG
jgi:anaerobic magnesium-protoporphyrin IX monomethyl ester cyclase